MGGKSSVFAGYFAHAYSRVPARATSSCSHPCDTVVDPAHRNQGPSDAMGRLASEFDPVRYRLFMN